MADCFGSWGVAVYGEEETVVQLMKRVRILPSTMTPVGDVLIGGEGGGVSRFR
jgi:hypothetical protein